MLFVCDCGEIASFTSKLEAHQEGWVFLSNNKFFCCSDCARRHGINIERDEIVMNGEALTDEERKLLADFRRLSPFLQSVTIDTVSRWVIYPPPDSDLQKKA